MGMFENRKSLPMKDERQASLVSFSLGFTAD